MIQRIFGAVRNVELFRMACLFAGILALLVMIPGLPMSFARVTFWSICVISIWAAAGAIARRGFFFACLLGAAAFLFNPFAQIIQTAPLIWFADVYAAALMFAASVVTDVSDLHWPGSEPPNCPDSSQANDVD